MSVRRSECQKNQEKASAGRLAREFQRLLAYQSAFVSEVRRRGKRKAERGKG
jgi:hypothetical protein